MNAKLQCNLCFQQFSNQSELKIHSPVCSILHQTKHERKRAIAKDEEESQDITRNISFAKLVEVVRELAAKNDRLEKKVAGLERWVNTKKKRVNIEEWLTKHVVPVQSWSPWAKAHFKFTDDNLDDFVSGDVTPVKLVESILMCGLCNNNDDDSDNGIKTMPIQAFAHKINEVYIYTKNKDKELVWRRFDAATDFRRLLMHIEKLISSKTLTWTNENTIEQKQMNLIVRHLAELPTNSNHTAFTRLMSMTYQWVKQEFKSVVEIEI